MIAVVGAFLATLALVPVTMLLGHSTGLVASPRSDRWNRSSVPRVGGLAIAVGLVVGELLLPIELRDRLALAGVTTSLGLLGLADDAGVVPPSVRLAVQAIVGGTAAAAVGGLGGDTAFVVVAGVILVPLIANATNLVDNADGLAATLSALSGLGLAGICLAAGLGMEHALAAFVVAAGCGAFLAYNRPPARVFMGDVGSLAIGGTLAGVALIVGRAAVEAHDPTALAALAALPTVGATQLGDLGMVVLTRIRRGTSPFRGGVDHTSHRLMRAGFGPWAMLAASAAVAVLAGLTGIAATARGDPLLAALLTIVVLLATAIFELLLARRTPYDPARDPGRPKIAWAEVQSGQRERQ